MKRVWFWFLITWLFTACGAETPAAKTTAPGDAAKGQQSFLKTCAECHGFSARGTDKGPPLIHKIYEPNHHADIAFVLAARQGVRQHHWPFGDMPAQPDITESQIRDIIAWVRQEQRKAGIH